MLWTDMMKSALHRILKSILRKGEEIYSAEDLHFKTITADSIFGGSSKQEAAEIFLNILKGNGSYEQNAVVLANAANGI